MHAPATRHSDDELEPGGVITIDELGDPVVNDVPPVPETADDLAGFSNDVNAVVCSPDSPWPTRSSPAKRRPCWFTVATMRSFRFTLAEQTCAAATAVGVTCEIAPHDEGHAFAESEEEALALTLDFLEREVLIPAGPS